MANSLKIKINSGNESYNLDFNNLNTQRNVQIEITLPDHASEPEIYTMPIRALFNPNEEPNEEPSEEPNEEPSQEPVVNPILVEVATIINRSVRDSVRNDPEPEEVNSESNNSSEVEEPLHPNRIPFEQETEDSDTSFGSRIFRAGDADRPPIAFDAYISRLPMIEILRSTRVEHIEMYKEFIAKFDAWIRRIMKSEIVSRARLAIEIDKYFYEYLIKFPFMLSEWTFNVFIELLSEAEPNETTEMTDDRNKMKNILLAINDGLLNDIIHLFDVPGCRCTRCSSF
jgi:hypothetical protein